MCHAVANEYDSFEQGAIYDWCVHVCISYTCVLFYLYVIWLCVYVFRFLMLSVFVHARVFVCVQVRV